MFWIVHPQDDIREAGYEGSCFAAVVRASDATEAFRAARAVCDCAPNPATWTAMPLDESFRWSGIGFATRKLPSFIS